MQGKVFKHVCILIIMAMFLCKGCGYKFRPRGRKNAMPSMCPACGRTGSVVETVSLINQFLNDADKEQ